MPMTALTSPETSCPSACAAPVHASLHQEPSTIPSHGPDKTTRHYISFRLPASGPHPDNCHSKSCSLHTVAKHPPSQQPPFAHNSSPLFPLCRGPLPKYPPKNVPKHNRPPPLNSSQNIKYPPSPPFTHQSIPHPILIPNHIKTSP